jgi:hypothetical protein
VAINPNSAIFPHKARRAMYSNDAASGISATIESTVTTVIASVTNAMK